MADETTDCNVDQTDDVPLAGAAIEYAKPGTPHVHVAAGITRGDIAALAVRILGIYMVVVALPAVGYVLGWLVGPIKWNNQIEFYLLYELVFLGAGTVMIVKGAMIGGWLLPTTTISPAAPGATASPQALQAVAFSVVGVCLTVSAFPSLTGLVAQSASGTHAPALAFLKPGVEFVLGLLLFFRGKHLARYWKSLPARSPVRADDDSRPL